MTGNRTQIWTLIIWFFLVYLASPSSAYASADLGIGTLPADVLMPIRLHDTGSGNGRGITFGVPVAEGEVDTETQLVVTSADGDPVPSQWNPLATWRTDGSVLHGAMTIITSESGNNGGIYYVRRGQAASGNVISKADIAASGFDAEVSVVVGGSTYSLSAADLLDGTIAPRTDYTHYSGPLSSEYMIGGPLRVSGNGAEHTLSAVFYVRAYGNPVTHSYVSIAFENTGAWQAIANESLTSVDLTIGGSSISGFPKSSFIAYSDFRYIKHGWWNATDDLFVRHDLSYVSDTKLMPKYRDLTMSEGTLSSYPQSTIWNQRTAISNVALESGGAKRELAPYDGYTAAYMVSGDKRAWNAMRAFADELGQLNSNFTGYPAKSAAVHSRDEDTGLPLDLSVRGAVSTVTAYTYGDTDVLAALNTGHNRVVASADIAHWPSHSYLPYLLTAESCELESIQMSANSVWINEGPGGNRGTLPSREWRSSRSQVRGLAWGFREIVNAAVTTPDHHPLRSVMQMAVDVVIDDFAVSGMPKDPSGTLGLWMHGIYAIAYQNGGQKTGVAAWMNDWLVWSIGSAYERGWQAELDTNGVMAWIAQGAVGRMGTSAVTGYCWVNAPWYKLEVRDSEASPIYTSWAEVYDNTVGTGTTCAAPGTTHMVGDQAWADTAATTYGAQFGGALAMAASVGAPGAAEAWDIFEARQFSHSWNFDSAPEWALVSRSYSIVRPSPPSIISAE